MTLTPERKFYINFFVFARSLVVFQEATLQHSRAEKNSIILFSRNYADVERFTGNIIHECIWRGSSRVASHGQQDARLDDELDISLITSDGILCTVTVSRVSYIRVIEDKVVGGGTLLSDFRKLRVSSRWIERILDTETCDNVHDTMIQWYMLKCYLRTRVVFDNLDLEFPLSMEIEESRARCY